MIFRAEIKEKLNGSNFGPSQDFMHMPSRVNISFDDFLGHLRVPPVCIVDAVLAFRVLLITFVYLLPTSVMLKTMQKYKMCIIQYWLNE